MNGKPLKPGGTRRHGMSESPEYVAWRAMRARCNDAHHPAYRNYGARGIAVCARWDASFEAFLADIGPRPSAAHQIERLDNAKGYEPSNCTWATSREQQRNRRNNRIVTYQGASMTLAAACDLAGLKYDTVSSRLHLGWDEGRALSEPAWPPGRARRNPIHVNYDGREMPLVEACRLAEIAYPTVAARLRAGVPQSEALSRPVRKRK